MNPTPRPAIRDHAADLINRAGELCAAAVIVLGAPVFVVLYSLLERGV